MAHPVTHFEVNARDPKAMHSFYGDLFEWKIDTNNPQGYGMVNTGAKGHGIGGGIGGSQNGRSWVTFYIETPDLAKTLAKAELLGGRTVMPPMDMGGVSFALFADPEGNVIGLAKSSEQPAPRRQTRRASGRKATGRTKRKTTARKTTARKRTGTKRTARRSRGR